MNITEITKNVFYAGVNDRVTEKFEGLWPLPYGVSYNSYIVKGSQKTALIDTVSLSEVREYLNNISGVIGAERIDYLIVNHMEPDHSGAIPEIATRYPDMKIVGNSKTIEMIKGFYHLDDDARYLEVKDGDTIDLGDRTLKFFLTPMVHWPETMVTYDAEDRVLFSGDAFGTFGALNGAVVDRDMDTSIHFAEMYRYYSNIVGKYGRFVMKAIEKLGGLEFSYICSTHGPVWHEQIGEVLDIVTRLATYTPEPGVVIVYGSMYGNTAEMAEMIARQLAASGEKKIIIYNASTASLSQMISDAFRYRTLIVGSATYSMRIFPPVEAFLNAMETREIKNKVFATFGNFTWAKGVVGNKMQEYADRMKLEPVATVSTKQSKDESTDADIREFVKKIVEAEKNSSL